MYEKTTNFCFDGAKVLRMPDPPKLVQRIGRFLQRNRN